MIEPRIARGFRQSGAYVPDGSSASRPIVAGLSRLGSALFGADRQEFADDEADREAAHRIEMAQLERERAATIADRAGALAELRSGLAGFADEARVAPDAKPGAIGHGDKVAAEVERRVTEFRETLGNDPEVTQRFEPLLRGEAAAAIGRERAWELQQFGQYQGDNWKKFRDSQAIELQQVPSGAAFTAAIAQSALLIDGMALPANIRASLKDDAGNLYAKTVLQAQLDGGNSAAVRALISLPQLKTDVRPKVEGNINIFARPTAVNEDGSISTVRSISIGTDEGEVLIPTVADDGTVLSDEDAIALYERTGQHLGIFASAAEATKYAEALHGQQAELASSPARFMTGFLSPQERRAMLTAADLVDQRKEAEASAAQAEQLKAAREVVATVKELIAQGAEPTPEQMKAVEAAGAILPDSEKVELAGLSIGVDVGKRTRGWSASQLRDWRNQMQAKVDSGTASQWEQMALQHIGARYEHAADAEAETNKEAIATPQGRYNFVRQLSGSADRAGAFDTAERASPGLGHVVLLPTRAAQQIAIEGKEIRKAQPDLVPMDKANKEMRALVGRVAGTLGDEFDDKLELAADMYAQSAARRDRTKDNFDGAGFREFVQLSLGATWKDGVRQGGIGRVNGAAVLLPDNQSDASFARELARQSWSDAVDRQGRPVAKAWIVGNMVPLWVRDDENGHPVYHFVDASGGKLMHKGGGEYRLTFK